MKLGVGVGLRTVHIVLDGDPCSYHQKGGTAFQLSAHVYCSQTAGWIKMSLSTEVGLSPGDIVLDGTQLPPTSPPQKKGGHSPQFLARVYCAKRLYVSGTTWYTDEGLSLATLC